MNKCDYCSQHKKETLGRQDGTWICYPCFEMACEWFFKEKPKIERLFLDKDLTIENQDEIIRGLMDDIEKVNKRNLFLEKKVKRLEKKNA